MLEDAETEMREREAVSGLMNLKPQLSHLRGLEKGGITSVR